MDQPSERACEAWRYYAKLERDVRGLLSYVEWDARHFPVYSSELVMLLGRIGQEAELLFKDLGGPGPLPEQLKAIEAAHRVSSVRIALRRIDRSRSPFSNLVYAPFEGTSPPWWEAAQATRRARYENASKGTFESVVKGLGALLWLNLLNLKPKGSDTVPLPFPGLELPHPLFELQAVSEHAGTLRLDPARPV